MAVGQFKPKIGIEERSIRDSIEQRYLQSFKEPEYAHNPKNAVDTCDLHLSGMQPVMYVTPKKHPVSEITWTEPYDKIRLLQNYDKIILLCVIIPSVIFAFAIIYFWGW